MVNREVIQSKLTSLSEYIKDLEEVQGVSLAEFRANKMLRRYVERTLQLAIEVCLDTGNHIISDLMLREPLSNRDVFIILVENGYLGTEKQESFIKMAGFRNLVIHDYARIEPEIVFSVLRNNLSDLKYFTSKIRGRFLI